MTNPQVLLSDPNTRGEVLAQLAQTHPGLQAQIAQHPNAYADLLDWISRYGTIEGQAAAAARLQAPPGPIQPVGGYGQPSLPNLPANPVPPSGDKTASKKIFALTIGAVVAVLALVAGGLVWHFVGSKSGEDDENLSAALDQLNASIDTAEESASEAQEAVQELRALVDATDDEALVLTALGTAEDTEAALLEVTVSLERAREVADRAGADSVNTKEMVAEVREVTESLNSSTAHLNESTTRVQEAAGELSASVGKPAEETLQGQEGAAKPQGMDLDQIAAGDYSSVNGVWQNGNGARLEIEGDTIRFYSRWLADAPEPWLIFVGNEAVGGTSEPVGCVNPRIEYSDGALVKTWDCTQAMFSDFSFIPLLEFSPVGIPIHTDVPIEQTGGPAATGLVVPSDENVERIYASTAGYSQATPLEYLDEVSKGVFTRVE